MNATDEIYTATHQFPREKVYALTSQLRRASSSVPMYIAEGYRRKKTPHDYLKHLRYADGSAAEVETGVEIAGRPSYLGKEAASRFVTLCQEIGWMLGGLNRRIEENCRGRQTNGADARNK